MTPTPILTGHARDRCAEMGISTKVAKAILRHADVRRPAVPGLDGRIATYRLHPDYAVVYVDAVNDDRPIILTVLFKTSGAYVRAGVTYLPVEAAS